MTPSQMQSLINHSYAWTQGQSIAMECYQAIEEGVCNARPSNVQHAPPQRGLAAHSVGPLYPFTVEPRMYRGKTGYGWIVLNLLGDILEQHAKSYDTYNIYKMYKAAENHTKNLKVLYDLDHA